MREAGVFLRISTKFSSRKEVASGEGRRRRPWGRRRRYRSKEKLMKLPVQITVRHMSLSEAAAAAIRDKAAKLDTFCDRIMSCRVLVEAPHRSQQNGMLYNVRIDLPLPGAELVVKREPHEDLYVAIRDAFYAARRQLLSHVRRKGGEVYFHENCVSHGGVREIRIGELVRFAETSGEDGPQATVISPVRQH